MTDNQMPIPEEALIAAKRALDLPLIVVICGSTRFMDEMLDEARLLTWASHIVIKPDCDMKQPHPLWADPVHAERGKRRLDELHRAKIRLADEVVVVGDYVGDSTQAEIEYARSLGKPVRFTHPEVDPDADGAAASATEHLYLSTGCLHGEHAYCQGMTGQQGAKRPGQCKFCAARCTCPCHGGEAAS
ncbi:hypothetical protein HNQ79_006766 [Streptomyces candidus]|uniref:Uncharacterized protein n=1 Tax=Streptomyces candidus TaxID=67283 RepID=A0A7X0LUM2_9ACTN|nr:hypothetical protein [Streptomyces candidus]